MPRPTIIHGYEIDLNRPHFPSDIVKQAYKEAGPGASDLYEVQISMRPEFVNEQRIYAASRAWDTEIKQSVTACYRVKKSVKE